MKRFIAPVCVSVMISFFVDLNIKAAPTDSVTATVTAQNISVTVTDGDVTYGTLALDTARNTTAAQENESQTATNDGNVVEDFNITGQDSAAWTLESAIGANQYTHRFSLNATDWTNITEGGYTTLTSDIAASGNDVFDLEIHTPSSSSSYTAQSVDVTVQAVLST